MHRSSGICHPDFPGFSGAPIQDPIADYLAMNVPDRITNVGRFLVIKKVAVDMEGNGKDDLLSEPGTETPGLTRGFGPATHRSPAVTSASLRPIPTS